MDNKQVSQRYKLNTNDQTVKFVIIIIILLCLFEYLSGTISLTTMQLIHMDSSNNLHMDSSNICTGIHFQPGSTESILEDYGYWVYMNESTVNCTINGEQNCIGYPLYDAHLQKYAVYRHKTCVYRIYSPQNFSHCLFSKKILIIGGSTGWELKVQFSRRLQEFYKQHSAQNKKSILFHDNYSNFSVRWTDVQNPYNSVYIKHISGFIANRLGSYNFLPFQMQREIDEKYLKYINMIKFNNATQRKQKVFFGVGYWKKLFFVNGTVSVSTLDRVQKYLTDLHQLLSEFDVLIYNMQLHDLAFWKYFGFVLKDIINDSLSFEWQKYRYITLKNVTDTVSRYSNLKQVFYWSSQQPSPLLNHSSFGYGLGERYTEYLNETVRILSNLDLKNKDWKYIDSHNITFDKEDPVYHDPLGIHYAKGIIGKMLSQMFVNAIC